MYWGKSLDQCTNQFCSTAWSFSLPFTKNTQQTSENNPIRIKNPKKSLSVKDSEKDKFSEKRSLKKNQNTLKSQTSSSINASSILFEPKRASMDVHLSKKASIRNFSSKEPIFSTKIQDPLTNDHNLRCKTPKNHQASHWNQVDFTQRFCQKQNKTKDRSVLKFSNHLSPSQNLPTKKYTHVRTSYNEDMQRYFQYNSFQQENSFRRHSLERFENPNLAQGFFQNGRNYQSVKIQMQNLTVYDPTKQNYRTVRYQNVNSNVNSPCIQLNSPRNYHALGNQGYTPVQSIQNLVNDQTHRYPPNQFPTIRQQNSTYEQSKSINDYENFRQLNSMGFPEQQQKTQKSGILCGINNSVSQQQQKNEETFYDVIRNRQPEFQSGLDSSNIEGNNKVSQFDLSCDELLLDTYTNHKIQDQFENLKIYQQIKRSYEEQEKYAAVHRRQMHQPSICLRVIENKLRGTSYQMSQTSSQGLQSQFKSSNPVQSHGQVIPSFPTPQTIVSPRQGSQASIIKSPCKVKMFKNSVRFDIEKKQTLMENKQNQVEQHSPIKNLDSDREIYLHNLATFGKQKEKEKDESNLVHDGLLKELNLNDIYSDREHPQPSIRKMCINPKKVKSLIQRKITIDEIFEDSSSFGNRQCSNQLITKYMLDDNFDNLDGLLSNQNVDRDESTVIDRYTFDSRLEKLP